MERSMETNAELDESLHQSVTVWKMIGKPFAQVDQRHRPGLAISWPATPFPFYNGLFLAEQLTDAKVHLGYQPTVKFMRCMLAS
jgi:hypothetical protein